MKKVLFTSAIALTLIACGGSGSEKKTETTTTPPSSMVETPKTDAPAVADTDVPAGADLIAKSDCLTCHKVSEKLIGPAYQEVANKYENTPTNVKLLAAKIKKGGKGVWGEVAMTPHDTLSEAAAEEMVKYVLSLKTK